MRLDQLKQKQETYYKGLKPVYCPALRDTVFFLSGGFNHLIRKNNHNPRSTEEQFLKLSCLKYVVEVIANCARVSETRNGYRNVRGVTKRVVRYELIHKVAANVRIRVILERVGSGRLTFLSIMPHDRKSKPKKRP